MLQFRSLFKNMFTNVRADESSSGSSSDDEAVLPQSKPLAADQVLNSAGGYTWKVDDVKRMRRFLCLGCEGGTYYIGEKDLALENAACIARLIDEGRGTTVLNELVSLSLEGRAAKQNPIIFALAMCARQGKDLPLKKQAYEKLSEVCRIPTHLFLFIDYCEQLSHGTGWGRAHRKAIGLWYLKFKKNPDRLAMHITKYKNRNGWTHKDVLRLAHIKPDSDGVAAVVRFIIKGFEVAKQDFLKDEAPENIHKLFAFLQAVEDIKTSKSLQEVVELIQQHSLVREHVPTNFLKEKDVWRALLANMPMMAMLRNLAKMTSVGLLDDETEETKAVTSKLQNEELLKKARIHPFHVLVALYIYKSGHGDKGKLKWNPSFSVEEALNSAFYKCFKFVEPTNKRYLLAVDVSGSMGMGPVNGSSTITPMEAAAALAMVTARTEANHSIVGFSHTLVPLDINSQMPLERVIKVISGVPMGATDCAQPMKWAKKTGKKVDVFVVYTDCETWCGNVHPAEALREYRKATGIWDAKLIVCAMTSNGFTIADPEDPGMLDMVGFDSNGPEIMRNFILGNL